MIAGPEVSRLVAGYEAASGLRDEEHNIRHHEQTPSAQKSFFKKVKSLTVVLREMGNPFQEESSDLLALDNKNVSDPALAKTVTSHHQRGKDQFQAFMEALENDNECLFYKPIKRNTDSFFRQATDQAAVSKEKILKDDCQLFQRLFISCQSRQCNLDEFFKHENQRFPAALSDGGSLHTCQKSQLAEILQGLVSLPDREPQADTTIIDGSAMVNAIQPRTSKTFEAYAREDIMKRVELYASKHQRVDIVFDVYDESSLKTETRSSRGPGMRRVTETSKTPQNWRSFLRNDNNKTELFDFLADRLCTIQTASTVTVIVTKGRYEFSNKSKPLDAKSPCTHEEADSRIFVHARDAVMDGAHSIIIRPNDTNVHVIAVSVMPLLQGIGLECMWLAFGQGTSLRWIPVHDVAEAIGPERASGLPFFHAFTGCDTVSAFRGKGKKTAWQTWNMCENVSATFSKLSKWSSGISERDVQQLDRFVVTMYDRSSAVITVNEARLNLFARKQRSYNSIPPTRAALQEHAKRAAYQAGLIWGQATISSPEASSPMDWGWMKTKDKWSILWTKLPPVAASCRELTKCGCKVSCTGICGCNKSGLPCTKNCTCVCQK